MLRGLVNQQIIQSLPYLDKEVKLNPFYQDFLGFLKYVEEKTPKLTQTKNLNLKSLAEVNELLIRKKPMEEKIGSRIFRVRSENKTPYIRTMDALSEVMGITKREKGRLRIKKRNKKFFDSLPAKIQFNIIWENFIHYLSWAYLQYLENSAQIAEILQPNQETIWLLLRDFDLESQGEWVSLNHTLETIRKDFGIRWKTAYGDNPDLARFGIELVIFKDLLKVLDLVQFNKSRKKFKLTDLGRKVISFQVSEEGIGLPVIKNWSPKQGQDKFKMPKWMECTWRRVACGKGDCPICGRIKRDRQRHIAKGEDPDDMKSVFEDVGRNLKEALRMVKKDAERRGIDITNINDIQEPPEPEEFSLYQKVKKWRDDIFNTIETAQISEDFWVFTEVAQDLIWYSNLLPAKVYRQLCNRWHIENGDDYGEFDYKYTQKVIKECVKILKKSLSELYSNFSGQKTNLILAHNQLLDFEREILEI